jgi:hypothetical protein
LLGFVVRLLVFLQVLYFTEAVPLSIERGKPYVRNPYIDANFSSHRRGSEGLTVTLMSAERKDKEFPKKTSLATTYFLHYFHILPIIHLFFLVLSSNDVLSQ